MYQRMKCICMPVNGASGPGTVIESFLSNPNLQEDCIDCLTMVPREKFSRYISRLLDHLGYSYGMVKERQQCLRKLDVLTNELVDGILNSFATGSKSEGIAMIFESDFDCMYIINDVICADNPQDFMHKLNITLFQTERGRETSPGYTRLRLANNDRGMRKEIRQSLFTSETGSAYLSSQFFEASFRNIIKNCSSDEFTLRDQQGPASPLSWLLFDQDFVFSLRCHCPDILNRWVSRPRNHGWPSSVLIHEVSLLDGHVVPVGYKGSENMYREWRICYTHAELHLIQNFNETQLKVCILLKKICMSVLKPVCEEMTSYIMKNVVFWICEEKGLQVFTQYHLLDRLIDCIQYLRACVIKGNLPSYMIPERNLLAGRLDIQQKHRLVAVIGDLLHEGRRMILRCDRIREAMLVMYREPDMFRMFCEKRDKLERLVLMKNSAKMTNVSEMNLHLFLQHALCLYNLEINTLQLLQFDIQALSLTGKTDKEIVDLYTAKLKQILS